MKTESLKLILIKYSQGAFNTEEAVRIIEDLYDRSYIYTPYYTTFTSPIFPENDKFPKYEVTCTKSV